MLERVNADSVLPPVVISPLAEVEAFTVGVIVGFSAVVTLRRSPLAEVTRLSLITLCSDLFFSVLTLTDKVLGVR